ncbi:DUF3124 domain-containing protein [Saprospiraceae bacterium]|nr:DUF3124 domain-containing protein [Saprospiraceae bacterium]
MKIVYFSLLSAFIVLAIACEVPDPNKNTKGQDELKSLEIDRQLNKGDMSFFDVVYVPIYSDIYIDIQNQSSLLAATLSIRNTSFEDSLFLTKIDYYDTSGLKVRSYLDNAISLPPMGTVNYVIEKDDDTGGPGANFIVELNAKNEKVKPLIQAIMIGENGNKGFAFATDGYSILK